MKGQRYAVGLLVVTGATAPTVVSVNTPAAASAELGIAPRLTGVVTGQTDVPASIAAASVADALGPFYAALTP